MSSSSAWASLRLTFGLALAITSYSCLQSPGSVVAEASVHRWQRPSRLALRICSSAFTQHLILFGLEANRYYRPASDKRPGYIHCVSGALPTGFDEDAPLTLSSSPPHNQPESLHLRPVRDGMILVGR